MTLAWKFTARTDGVRIGCVSSNLLRWQKSVPTAEWGGIADRLPGLGLLRFLLDAEEAVDLGDAVLLPHGVVASLEEAQAASIGLPPAIPHALHVRSRGRIDERDFSFAAQWLRFGNTPVGLKREGAIAHEGARSYRIPWSLSLVSQQLFEQNQLVGVFEIR